MGLSTFRRMSVAAVSLVFAGPAFAAREVQTSAFNYGMDRNLEEAIDCYDGYQALSFDPFDTNGGARTLDQVTLSLNMNINGGLLVSPLEGPEVGLEGDQPAQEEEEAIEIELLGDAMAGDLSDSVASVTTEADFDNIEDDGQDVLLIIDEDGSGSNSISTNLDPFINIDPVNVLVSSKAMVVYNNLGQIGRAENLTASGNVSLAYDYTPSAVPTPTAFGGGLVLLTGLVLRRRTR